LEGGPVPDFPFGFGITRSDGVTVEAMGVYTELRGQGAGQALASYFVTLAAQRGKQLYEIDALNGALKFWRRVGFSLVPAREIPKYKMRDIESKRPMVMDLVKIGRLARNTVSRVISDAKRRVLDSKKQSLQELQLC
jgi:ribosomal protein S18 acetylase RimI-like enzyme